MNIDRTKRDISPITDDEDRKVYFAVRKIFSGEDVDEKTYDTTSYTSPDIWAYLFTYGYQKEEDRLNFTTKEAENVIQMRKKYGLGPNFEPEYWLPKWTFSIPLKDFQEYWPSCTYGRDKLGTLCCYDTIGNIKYEFLQRLQATSDGWEAASHYIVRNMENGMRVKLMMSYHYGYRCTCHLTIVDVSNVGFTTFNVIRSFLQQVTGDIQRMYPEVVKRSYLVNSGWVFKTSWKIIKKFLHPDTVAKVAVFGSDHLRKLSNEGIINVPTFIGGKCNDYNLGVDNIYPPGSRILPSGKVVQEDYKEEYKSRPVDLDIKLDENKTKPGSKKKEEASDNEDSGPSLEEIAEKNEIELSE